MPGPFDAVNITGKNAKGRQHCLVCEYGLNPVVVVFAREPAAGQDGPLMSLLGKLDEEVSRYADDYNLKSFVIFIARMAVIPPILRGSRIPRKSGRKRWRGPPWRKGSRSVRTS